VGIALIKEEGKMRALRNPNDSAILLNHEFKVALKRNKVSVLRLFEGRQVQPTEHVIRFIAPFTLRSPVDPKEVALLGDLLDPNKTGFVTIKRMRDLVISYDDDDDEIASSTSLVLSNQGSYQRQKYAPPKRAPPAPISASSYVNSTSLVTRDMDASDPDKLAIMTAVSWSGKHLSQPNTLDRRLVSTPISRYAVPLSTSLIPAAREEIDCSILCEGLCQMFSDEERGWAAAALVATHVRSEMVLREMLRDEVPEILVPEDLLQAFVSTPRSLRSRVLESAKGAKPHEMFRNLSAVRLPLAVTALRVELESSTRKVVIAFLPKGVAGAWMRSTESARCAFVTSLLELDVWDEDFFHVLGGSGLESILLSQKLLAIGNDVKLNYGVRTVSSQEEKFVKSELEKIIARINRISVIANAPMSRSELSEDEKENGMFVADEDDLNINDLKQRIAHLCGELLL